MAFQPLDADPEVSHQGAAGEHGVLESVALSNHFAPEVPDLAAQLTDLAAQPADLLAQFADVAAQLADFTPETRDFRGEPNLAFGEVVQSRRGLGSKSVDPAVGLDQLLSNALEDSDREILAVAHPIILVAVLRRRQRTSFELRSRRAITPRAAISAGREASRTWTAIVCYNSPVDGTTDHP